MEHLKLDTNLAMQAASQAAAPAEPGKLAEAAQLFEAYFLRLMLAEMQKTVGSGSLFKDGSTRAYGDMMYDALATRASEAGSFGLAQQMLERMPIDYQGLL